MRRFALAIVSLAFAAPAFAYVEAPMSFGSVIQQSTAICSMVVTKVDKTNNIIIFQKVADLKGKHPQDTIKHNIGRGGLRAGEWEEIMKWAEVGKPAVFFHNGSASETYIGSTYYQAYPNGEWWGMSHGEPFLLRSYSGKVDKLTSIVRDIVAGKELTVPCLVDGDKEALHKKTAKIQRLKVSLKLQDYNPKRDFVAWGSGGDEIRRLAGMPGFDRIASLGKGEAEAQSISAVDFDGDGKLDICLCGANKVSLMQQADDGYSEATLPGLVGGARSAVWADYNGDGLPDLLLATPTGPKLYTNLGKGAFRDDSKLLPKETAYNLTSAALGDFNGDGKPDILLANGFHGLRLYKNLRAGGAVKAAAPKLGGWHAIGPFRDKENKPNFGVAFAPETEKAIDLAKTHKGKRDLPVKWEAKGFADGKINDLASYGGNCAAYLYREIECAAAAEFPVSLGADDNLTVWLNGEKIHSDATKRALTPDQVPLKLKLKAGKNQLLLKVCNSDGAYAFLFASGADAPSSEPGFADVSAEWGLGGAGLCADRKGDTLSVADFDNDGKPDFLFGAGEGILFRNTGAKFELVDSGIRYATGKVGPSLGDFDRDGLVDIFIPQTDGQCKLYKNLGGCKFADVAAKAGDLGKNLGRAVGAAWGDFDNDGHADIVVSCLKGTNKYFKNNGDGTFTDKSADVGLNQKVWNTQAVAWADLNGDGRLDLLMHNEGQESAALFGGPADAGKWTPIVVKMPKDSPLSCGSVTVKSDDGKTSVSAQLFGGNGRGGQGDLNPRFVLAPGAYTVTVKGSDGKSREQKVTVAGTPMNVKLD